MTIITDTAAIGRLKARYCHCLDSKDWSGFHDLLNDDAAMDTTDDHRAAGGSGTRVLTGASRIVRGIASFLGETVTAHQAGNAIITVSGNKATGVWTMSDRLFFSDGSHMIGHGHYHDTFECTRGAWRITRIVVSRTRIHRVGIYPA